MQVKLWIDSTVPPVDGAPEPKGPKKKSGSLAESWTTIRGSPKIMNLALIVICYAVSHRLFEFAWKGQLRVLYPTAMAYSAALADVAIYTGASRVLVLYSQPCLLHASVQEYIRSPPRSASQSTVGMLLHMLSVQAQGDA